MRLNSTVHFCETKWCYERERTCLNVCTALYSGDTSMSACLCICLAAPATCVKIFVFVSVCFVYPNLGKFCFLLRFGLIYVVLVWKFFDSQNFPELGVHVMPAYITVYLYVCMCVRVRVCVCVCMCAKTRLTFGKWSDNVSDCSPEWSDVVWHWIWCVYYWSHVLIYMCKLVRGIGPPFLLLCSVDHIVTKRIQCYYCSKLIQYTIQYPADTFWPWNRAFIKLYMHDLTSELQRIN